MAKNCCICGIKRPSYFGAAIDYPDIRDGIICRNCIYKMGYSDIPLLFDKTSVFLKELYEERSQLVESFTETRKIGEKFRIDDNHRLFTLDKVLFTFSQLKEYRVFENGASIQSSKNWIGRAVLGDLLFGKVGAIIGANTAKRVSTDYCDELMIRLVVDSYYDKTFDITFAKQVSKTSDSYKSAVMRLEKYTVAFDSILGKEPNTEQLEKPEQTEKSAACFSEAEEILKFKKLMDAGIITEEEFQAKKKQLLHI